MSAVRALNSKIATRTVWSTLAVLFIALLLYSNHADIASYAKTILHESTISQKEAPGGEGLNGTATLFW